MNNSQTAFKVRAQLIRFLGIFSPHFSKPALKFLGDMLYGLQASKDVKLSCIGRGLDEDILLKKTEERLSRNLQREGLAEGIFQAIAQEGAKRIGRETLVVVDPTDIRKLYAKKMPYLANVRDGSTGKIGPGYWGCAAVACESGGRRIIPLHLRLWSCESPGFTGENDQIISVIDIISTAVSFFVARYFRDRIVPAVCTNLSDEGVSKTQDANAYHKLAQDRRKRNRPRLGYKGIKRQKRAPQQKDITYNQTKQFHGK